MVCWYRLDATEKRGFFVRYLELHEVLVASGYRRGRIKKRRNASIKFPGMIARYDRLGHAGCKMRHGHASSRVRYASCFNKSRLYTHKT